MTKESIATRLGSGRVSIIAVATTAMLVLGAQLIVAMLTLSQVRGEADKQAQQALEGAAQIAAAQVGTHTVVAEDAAEVVASKVSTGLLGSEPDTVLTELTLQLAMKSDLRAMLVAYPDGEMVFIRREGDGYVTSIRISSGDGTGVDTRTYLTAGLDEITTEVLAIEMGAWDRAWWDAAFEASPGSVAWSVPQSGTVTSDANVWASTRVVDDAGALEAVVSAGLMIEPLSVQLSNLPLGAIEAEAVVTTRDGVVVAAPLVYQQQIAWMVAETGEIPTASDLGFASDAVYTGVPVFGSDGDLMTFERALSANPRHDWVLHVRADEEVLASGARALTPLVQAMAITLVATVLAVGLLLLGLRSRFARMRNRAETDALTGIANRRTLLQAGDRLLRRAERSQQRLIVASFDVDKFKELNDEFGHDAGDRALTALAKALRAATRETDVVARLGGDEFMAALVVPAGSDAWTAVERIRAAGVDELTAAVPSDVGLTAGFAVTSDHYYGTFESMMRESDRHLVEGKRLGKGASYGQDEIAAVTILKQATTDHPKPRLP